MTVSASAGVAPTDRHHTDHRLVLADATPSVPPQALDRDEGTGGREVWDLSVLAWDDDGNGLGSSVPFRLTLTDINDNAPYLIQVRPVPYSGELSSAADTDKARETRTWPGVTRTRPDEMADRCLQTVPGISAGRTAL